MYFIFEMEFGYESDKKLFEVCMLCICDLVIVYFFDCIEDELWGSEGLV